MAGLVAYVINRQWNRNRYF